MNDGDKPFDSMAVDPLPLDLVDDLERLTRERARNLPGEPPAVIDRRRARIDELVTDLKARRQPGRGDVVLGVRLERINGRGNVGALWEGVEVATGAARAVRLFDTYLLGKSLALHHFRRGLNSMVELGRDPRCPPSILRIHRFDRPLLVAVMDWMPGGNLGDLKQRGLSRERKLVLFAEVCEAVKFAHERAVLHRDIKPANILFGAGGEPHVTDFDLTDPRLLKRIASPTGDPSVFCAPEERLGTPERELTSDVFSLGRLLQFLLVEHDPIDAEEAVPRLAELIGQPQGLIRIIRKCTMREPHLRYPSITDLLEDLGDHEERPGAVGAGVSSAERVERVERAVRAPRPSAPLPRLKHPSAPPPRAEPQGWWKVIGIVAGAALVVGSIATIRSCGGQSGGGPVALAPRGGGRPRPSKASGLAEPMGLESPRSSGSHSAPAPLDLGASSALPSGMAEVSVTGAAEGNAEGAMVFVDGTNGGAVPCDLTVTAGAHRLEVKRNGFEDFQQELSLAAGDHGAVVVRLTALAQPGSIAILGENLQGAQIYVDGTLRGEAPGRIEGLAEGDHLVELQLGMARPWSKTVHVAPGIATQVAVKFTYYPR